MKDLPQSDCRISNELIKSQWRHTDEDIKRWRQHKLWKLW